MATILPDKQTNGFKTILCSRKELITALAERGVITEGICDFCDTPANEGYYIAVLNSWYCKKCFERFIEGAKPHPEDAQIEARNFEYYKLLFRL